MHDFDRHGFNRNVFGDERGWNRWARGFWGPGWDSWGGGWGGWAGPVFWPFLYGDVLSFVLWPYDYYDPFWAFGPDFLLASIFAAGPYFGTDYGYEPDYYGYNGIPNVYYGRAGTEVRESASGTQPIAKANQADRDALAQTSAAATESCSGLAPDVTKLPTEQIQRTINLTADQQAALKDLDSASARANDTLAASCPQEVPLIPVGRLDAVEKRLEGMIAAMEIMRPPLETFYDLLSDEQKKRFDAMEGTARAEGGNLTSLCSQKSAELVELPVQRIERVVQPNTPQQSGAFSELKSASEKAVAALQNSCPGQMPATPVARLDAAKARLSGMVDALKTIRPALEAFYASLNDEQKARFNVMGPPLAPASSPRQSSQTLN